MTTTEFSEFINTGFGKKHEVDHLTKAIQTARDGQKLQAIKDLRQGKIDGVIASTIWDQGVDIPEIRTLIMAGGGKSLVRNLQRLGRGLRIAEGKTSLEVYDFYDNSTRWLRNHSSERKKLWDSEGFNVTTEQL